MLGAVTGDGNLYDSVVLQKIIYIPLYLGEWNKIMLNDRIGENIPIISISKNLPKKCTFHISHGRKPFWTPNQVGNGENVETVVSRHGIFGCNLGWVCDGNSMESASFVADFV